MCVSGGGSSGASKDFLLLLFPVIIENSSFSSYLAISGQDSTHAYTRMHVYTHFFGGGTSVPAPQQSICVLFLYSLKGGMHKSK